jgi:hypothetical protein
MTDKPKVGWSQLKSSIQAWLRLEMTDEEMLDWFDKIQGLTKADQAVIDALAKEICNGENPRPEYR